MRPFLLLILFAAAGCTGLPDSPPRDGHLYEYVRSNRDGSLPETILVYLPSPSEVEVVKIVEPCTSAAYVTATIDPGSGSATKLVAGRLGRDGGQEAVGVMQYDPVRHRIEYELGPQGEARGSLEQIGARWHLYDYDFATLVASAHYRWPLKKSTTFDLVRLMPSGEGSLSFERLGEVELTPGAARGGKLDYRIAGTGLPEGRLSRRLIDGAVLAISSSERNHLEYRDFAMRLIADRALSAEGWSAHRAAHWASCDN